MPSPLPKKYDGNTASMIKGYTMFATYVRLLRQSYLVPRKFKFWSSLLTYRPLTPCPLPWGEGGRRPGEGSAALGDPTLGGKRLLATILPQGA